MNKDKLTRAMDKVKIQAILQGSVFITTIGFSLKLVWDENIDTAGTNGKTLLMNPEFFMSLTKDEQLFLYLHEIWHVAFLHMIRGKNLNHSKFNAAADHCINLMLKAQGFSVIKGALCNKKYTGMSTEQIYALLPDSPKGSGGSSKGKGTGGSMPPKDVIYVEEGSEELETGIENIVVKAAINSAMNGDKPGSVPESILTELDRLINPVLDWQAILMNFLTDFAKEDYSYRRPNRRMLHTAYMPTLHSEGIKHISMALDVSSSVTEEQEIAFLTEVNYIHEVLNPELLTIVTFNTEIQDIKEIEQGDAVMAFRFHKGGGTSVDSTIAHYNKLMPTVVIIFSDLEMHEPENIPKFPHVWLRIGNNGITPNTGTVIQYPDL